MPYSPFAHQARVLEETRDNKWFAIFWEMGTGKTKLILDNMRELAEAGSITGALVVAPGGVHRNWVEEEIPKHWPELKNVAFWTTKKAKTVKHKQMVDAVLRADGFSLLAISYSSYMTIAGREFCKRFMQLRKTFLVLDESTAIKNPGAKRTRAIVSDAKRARYRRVLTGTPVPNSPFDVYAPFRFLDGSFWRRHGMGTFAEFKVRFGVFEEGLNRATGQKFPQLVGYRNLPLLGKILEPYTSRVTKDEVLDLPPKLYAPKRYFELSEKQVRAYSEMQEMAMTLIEDEGIITAPLAITRLLRAQQITSNYLPMDMQDGDDGQRLVPIDPDTNPRLNCLMEVVQETPGQMIIWARFRPDVTKICEALAHEYGPETVVRHDGAVDDDGLAKARHRFQYEGARFFVGNPAAGAEGFTLTAARTVIYYNLSFNLKDRQQSEDRAHRAGQEHPVLYIDIMAPDTVDEKIVEALRRKVNVSAVVTGDTLKDWI